MIVTDAPGPVAGRAAAVLAEVDAAPEPGVSDEATVAGCLVVAAAIKR
jgi:hypothetical protein